jgi:hypothetical protein
LQLSSWTGFPQTTQRGPLFNNELLIRAPLSEGLLKAITLGTVARQ